jgi:hypothetical protein
MVALTDRAMAWPLTDASIRRRALSCFLPCLAKLPIPARQDQGPVANTALQDDTNDPYAFACEMVDIASATTRVHPHANRVGTADARHPMVADAAHFFALLHAERPSIAAAADRGDNAWLTRFAGEFDKERAWLARIAGSPRRYDLVRHENLVRQQREAMLTLVASERKGCPLGAIVALAADWPAVRRVLLRDQLSPEIDPTLVDTIAAAAETPLARRAIGFGIVQTLAAHRALWDLLEARQAASLP